MKHNEDGKIDFGVSEFKYVTNEEVEKYRGLVFRVIKKYEFGDELDIEEKIAEGMIGVAVGLEKFDPSRGIKLTRWLAWNIKTAIRKETRNRCRQIQYVKSKKHRRALRENYEQKEKRMSNPEEPNERDLCEMKEHAILQKALAALTDDQRLCVQSLVFESKTQKQFALERGVSQSWISRIWLKSRTKMRKEVGEFNDWLPDEL